jgi:ComF family protein
LYRGIWSGLDLIFPPVCAGCKQLGHRICSECLGSIVPLAEPLCERCGLPQSKAGICRQCQDQPPSFDALRSWSAFEGPLRSILHRLKYRRDVSLGDSLAFPFATFVAGLSWNPDILVPIPLSRLRLAERGYNQVGVVGRPLSMALSIAYVPRALSKERETHTQVGLTAPERKENVRDAFRARTSLVAGKSVLLLDDVATSGATLSAAAESLKEAGAKRVLAVTLARALPRHGLVAA